jgi:hypothetical protein
MSEIINLAKDKPDTYVYQQAAEIMRYTRKKLFFCHSNMGLRS